MAEQEPKEPYNASEETHVRAGRRKAKLERDQHLADVRLVMDTLGGRRVMWGLLVDALIFRTTFAQDPCVSAFQEGNRNLGLKVLADVMEACPELYLKAQTEANQRKEQDDNG